MTLYELMVEVNNKLIKREGISEKDKNNAVKYFLENISNREETNMINCKSSGNMSPFYYVPLNNEKYRMITGYKPKTNILSGNAYELEILILLYNFTKDNKVVKELINNTVKRIDQTCFGHYCSTGECLPISIVVLRFLNAINIENKKWIMELFNPLIKLFIDQKELGSNKKIKFQFYYFCLALCELPIDLVEKYIKIKKDFIIKILTRGCLIGPRENDTYNPLLLYILRNLLSRTKDFEYIKNNKIYIKDNRCYCDI
jgi:hypothetical protein